MANGFSELNDPEEQAERFAAQARAKAAGDEEAMYYDADYIRALEYGMPPAAGCGVGVDRFIMLLADAPSIRDVILFPHLRPEVVTCPTRNACSASRCNCNGARSRRSMQDRAPLLVGQRKSEPSSPGVARVSCATPAGASFDPSRPELVVDDGSMDAAATDTRRLARGSTRVARPPA
jgi:hypothetical protein